MAMSMLCKLFGHRYLAIDLSKGIGGVLVCGRCDAQSGPMKWPPPPPPWCGRCDRMCDGYRSRAGKWVCTSCIALEADALHIEVEHLVHACECDSPVAHCYASVRARQVLEFYRPAPKPKDPVVP